MVSSTGLMLAMRKEVESGLEHWCTGEQAVDPGHKLSSVAPKVTLSEKGVAP